MMPIVNQFVDTNQNHILDTCLYEVEFPGVEIKELAVNITTELMYAQCNSNGNKYLLFELFVNQKKLIQLTV